MVNLAYRIQGLMFASGNSRHIQGLADLRRPDIVFVKPLFRERYDLVMPRNDYESQRLSPMLKIIASHEFRKIVDHVGGYDTSQTSMTTFLNSQS